MIKVCFFTKYPPTEGYIASYSYWLARGLGEKGVEVHIVTNSLEEELWREKIDFTDYNDIINYQPLNVYVHSLEWSNLNLLSSTKNLLFKNCYESRLLNVGLDVISRYRCDIIDSNYLLPYGVAAYFAKKITGLPLILRHGVSDIINVIYHKKWHSLFSEIFSEADVIFTDKQRVNFFRNIGIPSLKIIQEFKYVISSKYFNKEIKEENLLDYGVKVNSDVPIITYLGKIQKGVYFLIKAASKIKENFLLLFITGGQEYPKLKNYIKKFPSLRNKYYFLDFIPPWKVPALLKKTDCLVKLEVDCPFHTTLAPLEAMAVGTCSVVSEETYEIYKNELNLKNLEKGKNILVVNPRDIKKLTEVLKKIINEKEFIKKLNIEAYKIFDPDLFSKTIFNTIEVYKTIIKKKNSFSNRLEEFKKFLVKFFDSL